MQDWGTNSQVMEERKLMGSYWLTSEEKKTDHLYPIYFGASCAFFALKLLSGPGKNEQIWCESHHKMLQGSAHLLGLLIWRIQKEEFDERNCELLQKLKAVEREVEDLKSMRKDDAKANEKVVGIYSAQEQSWLTERKKLRQQIGALLNELRVLESKKDQTISELNAKLQSKDKALEEEEEKKKELEEKLKKADNNAQDHSSELLKHKTAFLEIVSNQRQLEAEMGRALRQFEAAKQELELAFEQKEEADLMVKKLSLEIVKMQKDLEQKDKILSALLRKSKLDTAEKQMLLKEIKLSKAKRQQAELETERWRTASESKHERHTLRSIMSDQNNLRLAGFSSAKGIHSSASQSDDLLLDYMQSDHRKEYADLSPISDQYSLRGNEELVTADVKKLESWVQREAEKRANVIEQRHHLEIDAFAEQLRLKDEKLEAFRWKLLSMEIEFKRIQSQNEGLKQNLSQLKQDNIKLEGSLSHREAELTSLKEKLRNCSNSTLSSSPDKQVLSHNTERSNVKRVKCKPGDSEEEKNTIWVEASQEVGTQRGERNSVLIQRKDVVLPIQSPKIVSEEEKDVAIDSEEINIVSSDSNNSPWKMDLHALGVSYKIKRLKQLVLMLERLSGKQDCDERREGNDHGEGFLLLISLLNKQMSRYQSLQGKTDELCKRMNENDLGLGQDNGVARAKEETKTMEIFLEETFQLQRYMVATGQKLMELQNKIASGFIGISEELDGSASFDMKRFADNISTLFKEIQRGLELRIARIIGNLEGTLACEGMIRLRKW